MLFRSTTCALAIALAAVACGDVRPGLPATVAERLAARDLGHQLGSLVELARSGDQATADLLLAATDVGGVLTLTVPGELPLLTPSRRGVGDLRDCVRATPTSATFTECAIGEHIVDGGLTFLGGRLGGELVDVFVLGPSSHGAATVDAKLSASDTVSGTVNVDVMWTAANEEHVLHASIRVHDVVLDAARCPVGGAVTITTTFDDPSTRAVTTLWFGPTCGDLLIAR
jgi:hypothetical protein